MFVTLAIFLFLVSFDVSVIIVATVTLVMLYVIPLSTLPLIRTLLTWRLREMKNEQEGALHPVWGLEFRV